MNSFGINGQMLGGNGFANAGDYVWGGEANFQNLLNDLMEQASRPPPPSLLRLTRPKTFNTDESTLLDSRTSRLLEELVQSLLPKR